MRLTRREIETQNAKRVFSGKVDEQFYRQMRNELIEYKFLEEELGVDISILIEALKKGIVILGEDNIVRPCQLRMFYEKPTLVIDYHDGTYGEVYVAGYKKTWVLEGETTND